MTAQWHISTDTLPFEGDYLVQYIARSTSDHLLMTWYRHSQIHFLYPSSKLEAARNHVIEALKIYGPIPPFTPPTGPYVPGTTRAEMLEEGTT